MARFTADQITIKISQLRQKDAEYRARYKMDYPTFRARLHEESFIEHIEQNCNLTWELALAD